MPPSTTGPASGSSHYRKRLHEFYAAHNPLKINTIDDLLSEHVGQEEELIRELHFKYGVRDFTSEHAVDDLYEHERYSYFTMSWGTSYPGHLLPGDRKRWSDIKGVPSSEHFHLIEPTLPPGYQWECDWEIDFEYANVDKVDGWTYALDFSRLNHLLESGDSRAEPAATDHVRRRRWVRIRSKKVTTESSPKHDNLPPNAAVESPVIFRISSPEALDVQFDKQVMRLSKAHRDCEVYQAARLERWNARELLLKKELVELDGTIKALRAYDKTVLSSEVASKVQSFVRKRDLIQEEIYFPEAKGYQLRHSLNGIFIGMKDFCIEVYRFDYNVSTATNSITVEINSGAFIGRGHFVKVIGEKGTRVPNTKYASMFIDTTFKGMLEFEYTDGAWDSTSSHGIEFLTLKKKLKGGIDFPSSITKAVASEMITSALCSFILKELPNELAEVLGSSTIEFSGEFVLEGPSIKETIDALLPQAKTYCKEEEEGNLNVLQLRKAQLNMLLSLSLNHPKELCPKNYSFSSVGKLLRYYNVYIKPLEEEELIDAWQQIIDLTNQKRELDPRGPELQVFSFKELCNTLEKMERKPMMVRNSLSHFSCSVDVQEALNCVRKVLLRRLTGNNNMRRRRRSSITSLYGIRVGRKVEENHHVESSAAALLAEEVQDKVDYITVEFDKLSAQVEALATNLCSAVWKMQGKSDNNDIMVNTMTVDISDFKYEGSWDLVSGFDYPSIGTLAFERRYEEGTSSSLMLQAALTLHQSKSIPVFILRLSHLETRVSIDTRKLMQAVGNEDQHLEVLSMTFDSNTTLKTGPFTNVTITSEKGELQVQLQQLLHFILSKSTTTIPWKNNDLWCGAFSESFVFAFFLEFCVKSSSAILNKNNLVLKIKGMTDHPQPLLYFDKIDLMSLLQWVALKY